MGFIILLNKDYLVFFFSYAATGFSINMIDRNMDWVEDFRLEVPKVFIHPDHYKGKI